MLRYSVPFVLILAACPDPERPFDAGKGVDPNQMSGGQMGGGQMGGGQMGGAGMGAATAGDPNGAPMPVLTVKPGEGVKVSGTFTYTGTATGKLRVDIFRPSGENKPEILHALTLDAQGPWEVELPKNLGAVNLLAFVDATGNGPDATEPSALVENLAVGDAALADLKLVPMDGAKNPFAIDPNAPTGPTNPPLTGAEGQMGGAMQPGMEGGQKQPGMQGGAMQPPMQGGAMQPGQVPAGGEGGPVHPAPK